MRGDVGQQLVKSKQVNRRAESWDVGQPGQQWISREQYGGHHVGKSLDRRIENKDVGQPIRSVIDLRRLRL